MKIAVIPNFSKPHTETVTKQALLLLMNEGAEVWLEQSIKEIISADIASGCIFAEYHTMLQNCDLVIAIGGDGTVIHCAADAGLYNKPILGINTGRLGYVAELETDELSYLKKLVKNDFETEKRMMLQVTVEKNGETLYSANGLNDAVISRGPLSKIIDFRVYLSENSVCDYRADGLIVSTPTGSTAYCLSAGGPIIEPSLSCMLLVPLCAHALSARPIIVNSETKLRISAESADHDFYLMVDGDKPFQMVPDTCITICKSDIEVTLIKLKKRDFYNVLNEKLLQEMK